MNPKNSEARTIQRIFAELIVPFKTTATVVSVDRKRDIATVSIDDGAAAGCYADLHVGNVVGHNKAERRTYLRGLTAGVVLPVTIDNFNNDAMKVVLQVSM